MKCFVNWWCESISQLRFFFMFLTRCNVDFFSCFPTVEQSLVALVILPNCVNTWVFFCVFIKFRVGLWKNEGEGLGEPKSWWFGSWYTQLLVIFMLIMSSLLFLSYWSMELSFVCSYEFLLHVASLCFHLVRTSLCSSLALDS
jgi:hypothetical protein